MDRPRWLDTAAAVLNELLGLLSPQDRDAAFEELVAKVRAKRAKSRSAVLEPVRVATPGGGTAAAVKPQGPDVVMLKEGQPYPRRTAALRPGPNPVSIPREEPK